MSERLAPDTPRCRYLVRQLPPSPSLPPTCTHDKPPCVRHHTFAILGIDILPGLVFSFFLPFLFLTPEKVARVSPREPVHQMEAASAATARWASLVGKGWAQAAKISEGWEKVSSFACGYVPIEVWRSPQRVHVFVAQVEGPLVNSYLVLPTECLEDNGLPHTLEHLCFLGSEDFP